MAKVFLSHSSADKEWYVNIVYNKLVKVLGVESVIIDNVSFQEGRKTIEEIYYHLDVTDLFVIFLSEASLSSPWVQQELEKVGDNIDNGKIYQTCPIIIDDKVNYDDERIPEWMRKEYNIQRIISQTKAANVIRQRMLEISFKKHPRLKERNEIFVGRHDDTQKFEERMDDLDLEKPIVIIVSGLEGVGRRTFLKKSLSKSNIIKETYAFTKIVLKSDESIEDFILRLYDLGFSPHIQVQITELVEMDMQQKEQLLLEIVIEIQKYNEIVKIIDNGCVINHEGEMAKWFSNLLNCNQVRDKVTFALISKFRYYKKDYSCKVYDVALPELDAKERNGLLKRYLAFEGIELETENIKTISHLLSGLPEQVFIAVTMLKKNGFNYLMKYSNDIVNFNSKRAVIMLQDVNSNIEKMEFLALISSFDYISISYILSIVSEQEKYLRYINELYALGICEYVGVMQEYIRVNDTIKDYIQRSEYKISKEHHDKMTENVKKFVSQIDELDYDVPEILQNLKVSLLEGLEIDDKYIIPSIYLKTMNDLYNSGKNKEVVIFADKALLKSDTMDKRIVFEIRYLLCSALAKLRDDRFKKEVMEIEGAEHDFLFGFYYRQIGRFDKALERINKSLSVRENFSKAKREKVQIYIGMQDYDAALEQARINYINYKDNPYHIQAYFACVIKTDGYPQKIETLKELINNMENIKNDNKIAKELTLRFKAQYAAFIENQPDVAMGLIEQAIDMNKNVQYARLVKFDIAERFDEIEIMQEVLDYFKVPELRQRYHDNIVCMEAIIKAKKGDCSGAIEFFKMNIRNYTDAAKDRFIIRLNSYSE